MGSTCSAAELAGGDHIIRKGSSSLQRAASQIDERIAELDIRVVQVDQEVKMLAARGNSDPSAKVRALRLLKQKKQYEQHRDQLLSTKYNVESVEFSTEQADVAAFAAQAMQSSAARLRQQQQLLGGPDVIDRLRDDLDDLVADLGDVQDALARNSESVSYGVDALDVEFTQLQAEVNAEQQQRQFEDQHRIKLASASPAAARPAQPKTERRPSVARQPEKPPQLKPQLAGERQFSTQSDSLAHLPIERLTALAKYHQVDLSGCSGKTDVLAVLRDAGVCQLAGGAIVGGPAAAASHQAALAAGGGNDFCRLRASTAIAVGA